MRKTEFHASDLQWKHVYLSPQMKTKIFSRRKRQEPQPADLTLKNVTVSTRQGEGKISNAGYDQMDCLYTELPYTAGSLTMRARIKVLRFGPSGMMTGQEGFGVFVRDTMEPDKRTGYPYSNTVLAGGVLRSWNVMLRSGIGKYSIKNSRQKVLRQDASFDRADLQKDYDFTLCVEKDRVRARILNEAGDSVFRKEDGADEENFCSFPYDIRQLQKRKHRNLYVGFFAARGAAIRIDTDSIFIEKRYD